MYTDFDALYRELTEELNDMILKHHPYTLEGAVADYIPELSKMNPDHLAISMRLVTGQQVEAGDTDIPFTMQSISKIITLAMALMDHGEEYVFDKVGMEPTGDPFNSIVRLETITPKKPLNPMINAGAIAVTSMIFGRDFDDKLDRMLDFVRKLSGNSSITYNKDVARSEAETADLNRALAYFMREHQVLKGDIDEILELYFKQCAIELHASDLARIGAIFANNGRDLETQRQLIPARIARICKTFMVTCGMYNASGEFAIRVGIPAKSGVSGGILGIVQNHLGIGILSPALDERGNSVAGIRLLETISNRWQFSIF